MSDFFLWFPFSVLESNWRQVIFPFTRSNFSLLLRSCHSRLDIQKNECRNLFLRPFLYIFVLFHSLGHVSHSLPFPKPLIVSFFPFPLSALLPSSSAHKVDA